MPKNPILEAFLRSVQAVSEPIEGEVSMICHSCGEIYHCLSSKDHDWADCWALHKRAYCRA